MGSSETPRITSLIWNYNFDLKEYFQRREKPDRTRVPKDYVPTEYGAVEIWDIMRQIADDIAFIHSDQEVHRDIKPRNGKRVAVVKNLLIKQSSTATEIARGKWQISALPAKEPPLLIFSQNSRMEHLVIVPPSC